MTLRKKTWLAASLLTVGILIVFCSISSTLIQRGFTRLEKDSVRTNIERARKAIANELTGLDTVTRDWASWDDTYAFIQDTNSAYQLSTLNWETLSGVRIDTIVYINTNGEVIYTALCDERTPELAATPSDSLNYLVSFQAFRNLSTDENHVTGIVMLPEGPALLAARPILTSRGLGPARGALIMMRQLDRAEVKALGDVAEVSLDIRRLDGEAAVQDPAVGFLLTRQDPYHISESGTVIEGCALLNDILGNPALLMRVEMPRSIDAQARLTLRAHLAILAVFILLGAAFVVWLLEKLVLSRLTSLRAEVCRIADSQDVSARVAVGGDDELSGVATAVNSLLEALRESEEKYKTLVDNVGIGIALIDPRMRVLSVNRQMNTWFPHFKIAEATPAPEGAICTGPTWQTLQDGHVHDAIAEVPHGDDVRIYKIVSSALKDEEGRIVGAVEMLSDITEEKLFEKRLHETRQMYWQMLDAITDLVVCKGPDSKIIWANKAYRDYHGITGEDLSTARGGITAFRGRNGGSEEGIFRTGKSLDIPEDAISRADGVVRVFHTIKSPIFDEDGKVKMIVSLSRDITERLRESHELVKSKEAAEAAAEAKSAFLANMSHEIRTPMNGVIGMTRLLLDTKLDRQQRDFAEVISTSGESLLAVINDILDFSKIEAGKMVIEHIEFDLRELIENTLEPVAAQAYAKGIELANSIHPELTTRFRGDPDRLRQILLNLAGNAVKFTEQGEVVVSVNCESETETQSIIRFEVRDSGIGMPRDVQMRIFQPFTQADASTTRRFGGTGLGLAIARQLVSLMRGKIGVRSEPGKGSTFWFSVPLQKSSGEARRAVPFSRDLVNARVLIVDDNRTNRQILDHQVTAWKMRCSHAGNADEALALLHKAASDRDPYELALLDMQMPGMNGLTLARTIKADPSIARTRLVMLTSLGHHPGSETLREAGIEDCLSKPVKQSRLFDSLVGILSGAPSPDGASASPAAGAGSFPPKNVRILVAEDNPINQKVALNQLQKLGYAADIVENGLEVLNALEKTPYDVILMDCQMPGMDGYEATRKIREREKLSAGNNGHQRKTYIIAMTAHAMEGDREICHAAGMDSYLSKPVLLEDLQNALERRASPAKAASGAAITTARRTARPRPVARAFGSGAPPVDMARFTDVASGNPDQLKKLIRLYLSQTEDIVQSLEVACRTGAVSEIQRLAHKGCGSSATCGVNAIVAPLRELEQCGREGRTADAAPLVETVRVRFEEIRTFLNDHLDTITGAVAAGGAA